jgi:exodeoxyribonuclease VII small subunit
MSETPKLGDDLKRLEEIVRRLEDESLDLDSALALFEEGVKRLKTAQAQLDAAEIRVRQVLSESADGGGPVRTEPLDG